MADSLDKFLAIPTSQKFVLLLVIMAGIGGAWYFLYASDTQGKITQETVRKRALNKQIGEAEVQIEQIEKIQQEIDKLKQARNEMKSRLPTDEAKIGPLLQLIHGRAKIVGLDITRFERQAFEPREMYVRIPVKMNLRGTFHQIAQFFYYIRRLKRIVNVENIKLTAMTREMGRTILEAEALATTFMYAPEGGGGGL